MSLSRIFYSDREVQDSLSSSANPMQEPPKARRHKKKDEENATRYIWGFDLDNRNENSDG
jgi:hypothetical protein